MNSFAGQFFCRSSVFAVFQLVLISFSVSAEQTANSVSATPPAPRQISVRPVSPVEYFRELLEMKPEEREKALADEPPEKQKFLQEKFKEYEAMSPEERELRLRMTQLRWQLVPLMKTPPQERTKKLANLSVEERALIEPRLKAWDEIPVQLQKEFLENEAHLGYIMKWRGSTAEQRAKMLETFPPERRARLEKELARWNSLPEERREGMAKRFHDFFELNDKEKSKVLVGFSETERQQMERTLKQFENLPARQRQKCVEAFTQFAQMNAEERNQFLRNAERWQAMSPSERNAWRELVQKSVITPPPPPPPLPPGMRKEPPMPPSHPLTNTSR